jgi:CheY-like chemotaxis protein
VDDIIAWLKAVEHTACEFYRDASHSFREHADLCGFLNDIAEDEAWHYHVMGSAAEYTRQNNVPATSITIDDQTRDRIESLFASNKKLLSEGNNTEKDLIRCIIETEFSEWNHIFLFVVNTLRSRGREFMYAAAKIQQHMSKIELFLESQPIDRSYLDKIRNLPGVWKKRILIVEDEQPIVELLAAILSEEAHVETAENGKEGLEKIEKQYYDAIIADIEMPVMNGIDFYQSAIVTDPEIRNRMLFFSGFADQAHSDFVSRNGLRYLMKPAPLETIKKAVRELLLVSPVRI